MHLQDSEVATLMQMTYRPARHLAQATRQHSYARLDVVSVTEPERMCGQAHRVGYVSNEPEALALYRLKIRRAPHAALRRGSLTSLTLPGYFVLKEWHFALALDV